MPAPSVLVVGDDQPTLGMFTDQGFRDFKLTNDNKPSLVCFTGGEDVSPSLYCEDNTASHTNESRDLEEIGVFMRYAHMQVPFVGICRGGQLINVLAGGRMLQHIEGHSMGKREIILRDKSKVVGRREIHEDHHQGMVPGPNANVYGVSDDGVPEIIYYPALDALCFQPHPEWGHKLTHELFFTMVRSLLDQAG